MYKHANGQPGNFKVYDKYHFRSYGGLTGGTYSFHTGREGRGIHVIAMEIRHSSRLPRLERHGGGEHQNAIAKNHDLTNIWFR